MENINEIEQLMKNMLVDLEDFTKNDEVYKEDMKDTSFRVQWKICGFDAYQIFEKDSYEHNFGGIIPNPDLLLTIRNEESAIKFLKGEIIGLRYAARKDYNGRFKIITRVGWKTIKTEKGEKKRPVEKFFLTAKFDKEKQYHPSTLTKLPMFRNYKQSTSSTKSKRKRFGGYIPINKSLGKYENTIIPMKVFEHFLSKAAVVVMEDTCGCRHYRGCKNHDVSIGCMHIGRDMLNRDLEDLEPGTSENIPGRIATKEEAIERVRLAYENGLMPLLGSGGMEGDNAPNTGKLLSMCFCCPCCCVNGIFLRNGTSSLKLFNRLEGLHVEVDKDICVGCGECLEICAFKGMEMNDEKAEVNQNRCLGCGKCETTCPNGAISIHFDDISRIDEFINTLESYVDVT
jgi:UDP-glucose 4-epimerase